MVLYMVVGVVAIGAAGADMFAEATTEDAAPLEIVARTFDIPGVPIVLAGRRHHRDARRVVESHTRAVARIARDGSARRRAESDGAVEQRRLIARRRDDRRRGHHRRSRLHRRRENDVDVQRVHRVDLLRPDQRGGAAPHARGKVVSALDFMGGFDRVFVVGVFSYR